jgi:paraquat-inducible protein B
MSPDPRVRIRPSRAVVLVWLLPVAAFLIVAWIGVRTFVERGPTITITFVSADGIEAGHTKLRHRNVDVGTVTAVALTPDMSHAVVTAALDRQVEDHVTLGSRFWIVRPRLSAASISGLSTLVSGAYIEMDPGPPGPPGAPVTDFTGLEEPPVVDLEDVPGKHFILHGDDLASLDRGSPLYFRGIKVGEVLGYALGQQPNHTDIFIYVRAPFDRLVHPDTRFWNVSGFSFSAGASGLRVSTRSLEALVAGGVAFSTAAAAMAEPASEKGAEFRLFNDQETAEQQPTGAVVSYLALFPGSAEGLQPGASVDLLGLRIGRVTDIRLEFDPDTGTVRAPVTLAIDPNLVPNASEPPEPPAESVTRLMNRLVAQGLRARLVSGSLLTGQRRVALDFVADAPPATIAEDVSPPVLPTADSTDLDALSVSANRFMNKLDALPLAEIGAGVNRLVTHLDQATSGPQLTRSLAALDRSLANIEEITRQANQEIGPTLASLHRSADAADQTLEAAQRLMGSGGDRSRDLPALIHELTDTARSVRELTDYLGQHPEALLLGRNGAAR